MTLFAIELVLAAASSSTVLASVEVDDEWITAVRGRGECPDGWSLADERDDPYRLLEQT
jgi:hypothetical protein